MAPSRILVVDDDRNFLRLVTEVLIGAGYDAMGCSDARPAGELASTFKPDLVILDISMPAKNGFELAKELSAAPGSRTPKIIFLTAHRAAENVRRAKASGGTAYLEKPVRSASLLWVIKTLLSGSHAGRVKAK